MPFSGMPQKSPEKPPDRALFSVQNPDEIYDAMRQNWNIAKTDRHDLWKGRLEKFEPFDSTLSLCMRAKRLTYGFETVKAAAEHKEVFLLLAAADLSQKTRKEVRFLAEKCSIPCLLLPHSMEQIAGIIGRKPESSV